MRLAVDRWGKIEASSTDLGFEVATEPDLSAIEYELVTVNNN